MSETKEVVHRYRWVIMVVLWSAYIVVFIHRLSIGPLAPFLKEEMLLSSTQIGGLTAAASGGYMASIVPAGWATDRFGIRRILLIGELIGGSFMMSMYLVPSYNSALVIMAAAGFGCGFLMPATTKGVLVWFPVRERAIIMGVKQTAVNVGDMLSAAILPVVAIAMGWRFGFLLLGVIAVAIGILSYVLYKDPPVSTIPHTADDTEPSAPVSPPASVSLAEFLKGRDIWFLAASSFFLITVEFGLLTHLVLYLTEELNFEIVGDPWWLGANAILAMTAGGGVLGKPLSGILSDRVFGSSRKKVLMLWGGIASIMCLIIAIWGNSLSFWLYPVLFVLGITAIGWGGLHLTLVAELAGVELAGRVTGIAGLIGMPGNMLGPILFGHIVDTTGSYEQAWLMFAGVAAICVVALFFVREERRRA